MSRIDTKDQKQVELVMQYRRVFGTVDGKAVLKDILSDLGYHSTVDTQNEAVLHNYGSKLLFKLGALQDHNEEALIDAYLEMPYLPPDHGDEE